MVGMVMCMCGLVRWWWRTPTAILVSAEQVIMFNSGHAALRLGVGVAPGG